MVLSKNCSRLHSSIYGIITGLPQNNADTLSIGIEMNDVSGGTSRWGKMDKNKKSYRVAQIKQPHERTR